MRMLTTFEDNASPRHWVAVNDGVMGGRSKGGAVIEQGRLLFAGSLSLENNGGFSSVRTHCTGDELADAESIVLRVRGDGRTYQLRLATDARIRGMRVSYSASFQTQAGVWNELSVRLADLQPSVRGTVLDGPPFDRSEVQEIGLFIGDHREGLFALEIEWIALQ